MILPAQTIRWLCIGDGKFIYPDHPLITPFYEQTRVNGMTFGVGPAGYDIRIAQEILLRPGNFVLASSVERFDIPADLLGMVCDKSTWARQGLAVQNTVIEPGWRGHLTLELSNHSHEMLPIPAGCPIAQVLFMRLENPTEQPYIGKYQNQSHLPVGAILDDTDRTAAATIKRQAVSDGW